MSFDPTTQRPEIDFPEGAPPADLIIEDVWEGSGAAAQPGNTVSAHYLGVAVEASSIVTSIAAPAAPSSRGRR